MEERTKAVMNILKKHLASNKISLTSGEMEVIERL